MFQVCNELNGLNAVVAVVFVRFIYFFYDDGGGHFLQAVSETISPWLVDDTSGSQSLGAFATGSRISSYFLLFLGWKQPESVKSLNICLSALCAVDIWLFLHAAYSLCVVLGLVRLHLIIEQFSEVDSRNVSVGISIEYPSVIFNMLKHGEGF